MESDLKRWSYTWHQPKKAASDEEYRGRKSSMALPHQGGKGLNMIREESSTSNLH